MMGKPQEPGAERKPFLFELNPETGEFLRRFDSNIPVWGIACKSEETFFAFRVDHPEKNPQQTVVQGRY